jgi:hypothetical protein
LVLLVGVLVAVVLLLAGLGGGAYVLTRNQAFTAHATGASSPSPTVRPVSPEAYQDALTLVDTQLAAALQQVSAARTPKATATAVGGLRDALVAQTSALRDLTPPVAVRTAHDTLATALRDLMVELANVGSLVEDYRICTGGSAIAKISSVESAASVRTAAHDLGLTDANHEYKFGTFLPAVTPDTFRQLANGTFLKKASGGSGRFKLENKTKEDAVVSLAPAGTKAAVFTLYVRAGGTSTATGIKNGSYEIYLSSGVDWEPAIGAFTRNCAFEKFTDPLPYKSTSTRLDGWSITLGGGESTGGTEAGSTDVDPADLPA